MSNERIRSRDRGQALVELIVVMPVLLLLLLAAADMGKLFVISGKSEIAARYVALRHFRQGMWEDVPVYGGSVELAPFGDAYPDHAKGVQIERLFFDDALDDSGEADGSDVTYQELGDADFLYAPGNLGQVNPLLIQLWDFLNGNPDLVPIQGARSAFTYDLLSFPYGREEPMEETQVLESSPSEGKLAASYDATGNFVMLTDSFSGQSGEEIRVFLQVSGLIASGGITYLLYLWQPFLP